MFQFKGVKLNARHDLTVSCMGRKGKKNTIKDITESADKTGIQMVGQEKICYQCYLTKVGNSTEVQFSH